jgi:hypothetical protein
MFPVFDPACTLNQSFFYTDTARPASLKVELYETEANSSHPHELETNSSYLQSIGLVDLDVLKDFEVKASEPFELTEFTSVPVYISDMQLSLPDDTSGLQTSNQLVEVALLTNSPTVNTVDNQTYKLVPNGVSLKPEQVGSKLFTGQVVLRFVIFGSVASFKLFFKQWRNFDCFLLLISN